MKRIILAVLILVLGCAWVPDAPEFVQVTLIRRPYGARYARLVGGTVPPRKGALPASLTMPEGYYHCEDRLSALIPEGVSFRDFLASYLEWRIPYQYGIFDCTEMAAAIEWLAENTGHDARVTCSALHCWVQIQLEDGNYYYYEAVQLAWVDDGGYHEHPYVFENIAEALAFGPWEGQFGWWTIPVTAAGGPAGNGVLGTHTVRAGEHLWAIARAYSVSPDNIAAASNISAASTLAVGQVLTIPDIKTDLPAGPTAERQFAVLQPLPRPPEPTPQPVLPKDPATFSPELPFRVINTVRVSPAPDAPCVHVVRAGEHLLSIARAYGISAATLRQTNGLTTDMLLVGQRLTIPNVPGSNPPGPVAVQQCGDTELAPGALSPGWQQSILQWKVLIEQYAARFNLDPNLVGAVMLYESAGRAAVVSHMGAVGLMQVMPQETGFPDRPPTSVLLDPASNLLWGCRILRACIDQHGEYDGLKCYYGFGGTFTESYARDVWALYQRHK